MTVPARPLKNVAVLVDTSIEDGCSSKLAIERILMELGARLLPDYPKNKRPFNLVWKNGTHRSWLEKALAVSNAQVVSPLWVFECQKLNALLDVGDFQVDAEAALKQSTTRKNLMQPGDLRVPDLDGPQFSSSQRQAADELLAIRMEMEDDNDTVDSQQILSPGLVPETDEDENADSILRPKSSRKSKSSAIGIDTNDENANASGVVPKSTQKSKESDRVSDSDAESAELNSRPTASRRKSTPKKADPVRRPPKSGVNAKGRLASKSTPKKRAVTDENTKENDLGSNVVPESPQLTSWPSPKVCHNEGNLDNKNPKILQPNCSNRNSKTSSTVSTSARCEADPEDRMIVEENFIGTKKSNKRSEIAMPQDATSADLALSSSGKATTPKARTSSSASSQKKSKARRLSSNSEVSLPVIALSKADDLINDSVQALLASLPAEFEFSQTDNYFTHLVVGSACRTLKVFFALARGDWIVTPQWVLDSVSAARWLDPAKYEFEGLPGSRSRISHSRPDFQALFSGVRVHILDQFIVPSKETIARLFVEAGSFLVEDADESAIWIGDHCVEGSSRPVVSTKWLLDSLIEYQKLNLDDYVCSANQQPSESVPPSSPVW